MQARPAEVKTDNHEVNCVRKTKKASTSKTKSYSYTSLSSVSLNSKVNVYGVIKFLKHPYKSRGSDYCMLISLVDDSMKGPDESLKCLLFAKQEDLLPVGELGDIVRFHRLSISEFRGSLQGQSSPGYSWLLWSGDTGASLDPKKVSSPHYQITEEDKEKVTRLRQWSTGKEELVEKLSTFHQIGANCYFDLICQVVSVATVEPNVCILLRVWDGTKSIYKVNTVEKSFEADDIKTDLLLEEICGDLMYDVLVYDNHTLAARKIKPGDYVKFTNLHAPEWKNKDSADKPPFVPTIELILHRGDSFGRGIRVLSPDFPALKTLKERLEKLSVPTSTSDNEFIDIVCGENERPVQRLNRSDSEVDTDVVETELCEDSDPRCMLQTKTVILNHPHAKKCKIKSVLDHGGPGKFRVCAKVLAYHPAANKVNTFLKLYCKLCRYLCDVPVRHGNSQRPDNVLEIGSTFRDVPHYMCPKCAANKDTLSALDSSSHLSYIYMMRFILQDDSGILIANLWRSDAAEFFKGIEPEDIIMSASEFTRLQSFLHEICPSEAEKPWIECCLRSYTIDSVKHFQMFDTAIV